jgi:hypothetical protein
LLFALHKPTADAAAVLVANLVHLSRWR